MNMFVGNNNDHFKDNVDLPKRMAGLNAAGPSLGNGYSNVAIMKANEESFTDRTGRILNDKDRADGQSYATQTWYEEKYLKTFQNGIKKLKESIIKLDVVRDYLGKKKNIWNLWSFK